MKRFLSSLTFFVTGFLGGFFLVNPVQADPPSAFEVKKDIPYAGTDNSRQVLDLYLPKKPAASQLPLVVYIHGGGWEGGSKNDAGWLPQLVTNGNYAIASVGYRLTDQGKWPAQLDDCKAALRWLRANADKYQFDEKRIALFGISAGGHLVSMLGTTSGSGPKELEGGLGPYPNVSTQVKCVINFCGPSNFLTIAGKGSIIDPEDPKSCVCKLLGGALSKQQETASKASPVTYISKDDPPFLSIYGTADNLVPYSQALEFDKALDEAGVPSILLTGKDAPHVFSSKQLIQRMKDFLAFHLEDQKVDIPEGEVEIK